MDTQSPPLSLLDGAALFLDFDGTLVELAAAPDKISVSPDVAPLLKRLQQRLDGRLALISGRAISDLERYVECGGLAVSGSHGFELRLRNGRHAPPEVGHDLTEARERLQRLAAETPGLLVEHKPFGVALHFRQAPHEQPRLAPIMEELAQNAGLLIQEGKMVIELRPPGADKGDALRSFMAEPEFAGARPVFVGDDMTDEHAFAAAVEFGGAGVLVGPSRPSAAQWRLDDVDAVMDWLSRAADVNHA